jgi:hypothetical protein
MLGIIELLGKVRQYVDWLAMVLVSPLTNSEWWGRGRGGGGPTRERREDTRDNSLNILNNVKTMHW